MLLPSPRPPPAGFDPAPVSPEYRPGCVEYRHGASRGAGELATGSVNSVNGEQIVQAVGAVVLDPAGRILLVQRGNPPQAGRWTVPGGKTEPGETLREAVAREVRE